VSLRLLVITDTLDAGSEKGSDVFCTALTHALRARHDVSVITSGAPDTGVLEVDGVIRLPPEVIADAAALEQALARHVAPEQFDFIYNLSGLGFGNTIGFTLLGRPRRIPLVNHFQTLLGSYALHEGYDYATVDFNQEGQKEIAKEAALNIFLSQSEYRDALLAGFDMSQSLASVIPAGVRRADVEGVVPSEVVPANGCGKRPTVFLTAGRFSDYIKGGDLVYRAFTYLHRRNPDVFLVVVSNSRRFADLLRELPATAYKIVDWLPRAEFLATIAAADVVVLPSRYESFGLTAVESMMLGKPVIANSVGGLQDIVHHGQTGLLNEARDGSFGLYRALRLFADRPGLAAEMGEAARAYAMREFNLERVCYLVDKSLAAAQVRFRSQAFGLSP